MMQKSVSGFVAGPRQGLLPIDKKAVRLDIDAKNDRDAVPHLIVYGFVSRPGSKGLFQTRKLLLDSPAQVLIEPVFNLRPQKFRQRKPFCRLPADTFNGAQQQWPDRLPRVAF